LGSLGLRTNSPAGQTEAERRESLKLKGCKNVGTYEGGKLTGATHKKKQPKEGEKLPVAQKAAREMGSPGRAHVDVTMAKTKEQNCIPEKGTFLTGRWHGTRLTILSSEEKQTRETRRAAGSVTCLRSLRQAGRLWYKRGKNYTEVHRATTKKHRLPESDAGKRPFKSKAHKKVRDEAATRKKGEKCYYYS